jgi:ABC-type multidrug transport system fused ATPase/permease subunit
VKEYNVHFAGAILAALPTLLVYIVAGRYFVRGLMAGSVKADRMGFLDIRNVTKSYGNVEVLHRVDLEAEEGEFLVLVGPSGCGKSTLLNMIAGLEGISSGDIAINGRVVNGVHPSSATSPWCSRATRSTPT